MSQVQSTFTAVSSWVVYSAFWTKVSKVLCVSVLRMGTKYSSFSRQAILADQADQTDLEVDSHCAFVGFN